MCALAKHDGGFLGVEEICSGRPTKVNVRRFGSLWGAFSTGDRGLRLHRSSKSAERLSLGVPVEQPLGISPKATRTIAKALARGDRLQRSPHPFFATMECPIFSVPNRRGWVESEVRQPLGSDLHPEAEVAPVASPRGLEGCSFN